MEESLHTRFLLSQMALKKKMDLISYEQYQFDWAKDYLLEGSLESVQTDLGTGLIVYNSETQYK